MAKKKFHHLFYDFFCKRNLQQSNFLFEMINFKMKKMRKNRWHVVHV